MGLMCHTSNMFHMCHATARGRGVEESQTFVTGGLLTAAEVARVMRVSTMTVYRLIKSGELPAIRVGKNYRLRGSDVERFLEERSVRTGAR